MYDLYCYYTFLCLKHFYIDYSLYIYVIYLIEDKLIFQFSVPGMMGSQIFTKKRNMLPGRERLPLDANHCLKQSALDDLT